MTAKTDCKPAARPLPGDLAEVAFLDIKDVCAAVRMSASWVYGEVLARRFPAPLRYGLRCARWTSSSVRSYMIARAAAPQAEATALVTARAKKASAAAAAARAKRATATMAAEQ